MSCCLKALDSEPDEVVESLQHSKLLEDTRYAIAESSLTFQKKTELSSFPGEGKAARFMTAQGALLEMSVCSAQVPNSQQCPLLGFSWA